MRIAIEKIIGLLKTSPLKNRMLRFIAWRILQTSKFDGNNYIDRWCKIRILTLVNTVILDLVVILIM